MWSQNRSFFPPVGGNILLRNSHHQLPWEYRQAEQSGPSRMFCVCVWCYLHTACYKWIFFLYSKWGVGRNISNNSSHTALFHPREERGVSLLNCKKKVSMQLKFSPCTRETASAQPAVPATTERSLIYPTDLYSRSSWGMEVKLWNNQE